MVLGQECVPCQLLDWNTIRENVLDEVSAIIDDWSFNDVQNLYADVRRNGLRTIVPNGENLIEFQKNFRFIIDGIKK